MTKSKNRFLYLALVFFLGIIAILVGDGYLGLYDTLKLRPGESYDQVFEADYWQSEFNYAYFGDGDSVTGTYTIDNRGFSNYAEHLTITVERNQQVISELLAVDFTVDAFGVMEFNFTFATATLAPADGDTPLEYTLIIRHGELERRVIFSVSRLSVPPKVITGG
ncbi:MAG: hypothetical protein P3T54_01200 [Dehalogenimonas sp.]|uniref:DUF1616 domain-containing protein n=1 Tax=Candidatus Dehalogenimonas loeffleri TaxID=3127115 RepID=A0ABZ2JAU3_9CHLR|nr:hypothetical protein [Dehalogenimonas sp.]